jgi:glycosyltransferase involved in cell wall biosynthesis
MRSDTGALRVAFFGHGEGRRADGLSTYSRELVTALRSGGAEVRLFAHVEDGDRLPVDPGDALQLRARRFKTVVIPRRGSIAAIRESLRRFRPDVVHISWSFSLHDGAIARAAHELGASCVATFHLPYGPEGTVRGRVLQGLYRYHRLHMGHVDRCIALSEVQRDLLIAAGFPADRITVIHNAVDTDAFSPGASTVHRELAARLVVLYLGRLDPEKRVPALVDTFLDLGLPDDHVLCIAGDGAQRDRLERQAAGQGNVRLVGLVTGARRLELLRGCDVFVLPSTAEGLALSLLEAMAVGCAIVATDAGDDGRALENCGVVIPSHPLRPALDTALRAVIGDPALRRRLGAAARDRAVAQFGMDRHADRVRALYAAAAHIEPDVPSNAAPAALP